MPRQVRSFVRRTGRMTRAQHSALHRLWPRFGIDFSDAPLDLDRCFGRCGTRVLEIGFGNGESMLAEARAKPESDFIGVEVHEPGVGHCLLQIESAGIDNMRLIRHDALEVLEHQLPDNAVARINLYFPDPWPKKRHHKRRIVQDSFLELAARRLTPGGCLCIATDWKDYAAHIDDTIARSPHFSAIERRQHKGDRPIDRATTRFERRGLSKGHPIWDWQLVV